MFYPGINHFPTSTIFQILFNVPFCLPPKAINSFDGALPIKRNGFRVQTQRYHKYLVDDEISRSLARWPTYKPFSTPIDYQPMHIYCHHSSQDPAEIRISAAIERWTLQLQLKRSIRFWKKLNLNVIALIFAAILRWILSFSLAVGCSVQLDWRIPLSMKILEFNFRTVRSYGASGITATFWCIE